MGKKEYLACLISLVTLGLTACSDNANKTGSEVSQVLHQPKKRITVTALTSSDFRVLTLKRQNPSLMKIKQRSYILQTTIRPLQLLTTTREYTMKFTLKTL